MEKFLKSIFEKRNEHNKRKKKFSEESVEHLHWVQVYKHMGPPGEMLFGNEIVEEVANPAAFADRGSGTKQRREQKLGRKHAREVQARRRLLAGRQARRHNPDDMAPEMMYKLGVE